MRYGTIEDYQNMFISAMRFMLFEIQLFGINFSMWQLFIYGTLIFLLLRFVYRLLR
jgi:hypothetical protein